MSLQTSPFEVRDFSGGLNDDHNTTIKGCYLTMDNLLLSPEGHPTTRYGSVIYNPGSTAQLPSGNQRVAALINYNTDDTLLAISGNRLFYDNAGTWTEILGPTGNSAIGGATNASHFQYAEWKRIGFLTSDSQIAPVKIYRDDNRGWQAVTAGLPTPVPAVPYNPATALASAITLANAIRTSMINHYAGPAHTSVDTVSGTGIAAAATTLPTLITLTNTLITAWGLHYKDAWVNGLYHRKDTSGASTSPPFGFSTQFDETLLTTAPVTDIVSATAMLNDIKLKMNTHVFHASTHLYTGTSGEFTTASYVYDIVNDAYVSLDKNLFYTYAEKFRSKMNAHFASGGTPTTAHSTAADTSDQIATSGGSHPTPTATDPESFALLLVALRASYCQHDDDDEGTSPPLAYHVAAAATSHELDQNTYAWHGAAVASGLTDVFFGVPAGNWTKAATALTSLQTAYNQHVNDWSIHYTTNPNAGSPSTANSIDPNLQPGGILDGSGLTFGTYAYAIVYKTSYVVNGLQFDVRSDPYETPATGYTIIAIDIEPALLQNIPPLVNTATTNYDTANVTIEIYRTLNNGNTFYLVGSIPNTGSTPLSFLDTVTDTQLLYQSKSNPADGDVGQLLYTTGGVNPDTAPPNAMFVTIANSAAYYANYPGGNSNSIVQSTPGTPDGVWGGNFVNLPKDVLGISQFRDIVVAWTATTTYRIEGQFDESGNGGLTAIAIANNVGLAAGFSPIAFDQGILFWSQDGIYLTDAYQVVKINTLWRSSYLNLIRSASTQSTILGTFDRNQKRVWWATNANSSDNDTCRILDVNFPLGSNAIFSTASNGTNFAPTALAYFKGQLIRGDSRGYVFRHDAAYTSDPKINTAVSPSQWTTRWIPYTYQSPFYDFGTLMYRKWNPRVNVKAKNLGNLSLQINLFTDDNTTESSAMSALFSRSANGIIEQRGHVPAGYLRCRNRSVQMVNAFVAITNSDTLGNATLNTSALTLTLDAGNWPYDLVDQYVTLANDGYVTQYLITAQSTNVLTITDPGSHLPVSGDYQFEIMGIPKTEQFQLISYALHVAQLGKNQPVIGATNGSN